MSFFFRFDKPICILADRTIRMDRINVYHFVNYDKRNSRKEYSSFELLLRNSRMKHFTSSDEPPRKIFVFRVARSSHVGKYTLDYFTITLLALNKSSFLVLTKFEPIVMYWYSKRFRRKKKKLSRYLLRPIYIEKRVNLFTNFNGKEEREEDFLVSRLEEKSSFSQ